jgi:hypothetical protein
MAMDKRHFPTAHKIGVLFLPGMAYWVVRNVFRERFLIRLALYGLLFVSLAHVASLRYLSGGRMLYMENGFLAEPGLSGNVHNLTVVILGVQVAQAASWLAVLCLIGIAATLRPLAPTEPKEPRPRAIVTADHSGPLPE